MKKRILYALILFLTFSVVACSNTSSSKPSEVSFNLGSEPPQMNYILSMSVGAANVLRHSMEGLVVLDEKDNPVPGVASSWDLSEDGKTYTFHLRKDARWSNDKPVTAHDFVYALNTLFTPETGAAYSGTWAPLFKGATAVTSAKTPDELKDALSKVGYRAIDDTTLEITTSDTVPYFLNVLAFFNFLPLNEEAVNAVGGIDNYATDADKMIYNGPFVMSEWQHEDHLVLEKNDKYWNKDEIKLDKITFKMIADASVALNEFEADSLDIVSIGGQQYTDLKKRDFDIQSYKDGSTWFLTYNTKLPGLNNAKIREAITLAIDAPKFVEKVVINDSTVANSFVPAAIWNGDFTKAVGNLVERPKDDFSKVVKLFEEGLKEEGLTRNDLKYKLILDESSLSQTYGAYFKEQLNSILGLDVEIVGITYKARVTQMREHNFDIAFSGWVPGYNDPMTFLEIFESTNGNNYTQYSNPAYDKLVAQARVESDADKRLEVLTKMEKILAQDFPVGYIYNRTTNYLVSSRVRGVNRTAFSDIDLRRAYIEE